MFCLNDIIKIVGVTAVLTLMMKYLIPDINYIESLIVAIIIVTVFVVLTTKNKCNPERYVPK